MLFFSVLFESYLFLLKFIENIKKRFIQVYEISASRTHWRIRENLESYILGFNGTTLDATWKRVFRDAFNMTFTINIEVDGQMQMLSDVLKMEGNSKIAFDEIIATIAPFLFRRVCKGEKCISIGVDEIECGECAESRKRVDQCIWNTFMIAASFSSFQERYKYNKVIDWLKELHKFEQTNNLEVEVTKQLQGVMRENLIRMCRWHNMRLASKSIKRSNQPYIESKKEVFNNYKEKFDTNISKAEFDDIVNKFLANKMG